MQFHIHVPDHPSPYVALLQAGRSALTTAILKQNRVFDLSRLSLLRFSIEKRETIRPGTTETQVEMTKRQQSVAGQHYLVCADFGFGAVDFEILDRKRGLKTEVLRHLPQTQNAEGDLTLEIREGDNRPLEDLVLVTLPLEPAKQITFNICGKYVL